MSKSTQIGKRFLTGIKFIPNENRFVIQRCRNNTNIVILTKDIGEPLVVVVLYPHGRHDFTTSGGTWSPQGAEMIRDALTVAIEESKK